MLNIKTAVSLEILADNLIEDLKKIWVNPLEAPYVIFPDSKLEQWFKMRWVEKRNALANLNTKRLDAFLFELLAGEDRSLKLLNNDLLRNIIISYLKEKNSENEINYSALSPEIKSYLEDSEGKLDESRLFDVSDMISSLLLDYELTRTPDYCSGSHGNKGVIDAWINNDFYFYKDNKNKNKANSDELKKKEEWQKKIYYDIFSERSDYNLLKKINNKIAFISEIQGTYCTLAQLFWKKYNKNKNKVFYLKNKYPVFIFGFSGLGQFYRNILKFFSLKHDLFVFLINPYTDMDNYTEECELLNYWGNAGKNNLKLWRKTPDFSIDTDYSLSCSDDCLLNYLQNSIINGNNNKSDKKSIKLKKTSNINDGSISIISAPSKLREVEILHTNICHLLNGKNTKDKKPANIRDVLVVSPNLDSYVPAINQVFNQSSQKAADEKDSKTKSVLHIPFDIVDSSSDDSLTLSALKTLFALRDKGSLSRPDFFALVRNPVVQAVRDIKPNEISDWEGWITAMNVYRDRVSISDDNNPIIHENWIHGVKRLLLAKLSERAFSSSEDYIVPFADIASSDNDSLCRFINCIEDLENWVDKESWLYKWQNFDIPETALDEAMQMIDKWLAMPVIPDTLGNEAFIYQKIIKAKDDLRWIYAAGAASISWEVFGKALLNAAKNTKYNNGNIFVNGITFIKFAPNRNIPVKYLFLLGADAGTFPKADYNNSLDLRNESEPVLGDESISNKEKYAFLSQVLNISEAFYVSYVDKNLQKDEDYYPSSLIEDIDRFFEKNGKKINKIDNKNSENRSWEDIFTSSEIRNKESLLNFGKNNTFKVFEATAVKDEQHKYPERVSIYQMREFLEEPFKARVNRILDVDEEEDFEKLEFEPVDILYYKKSQIKKQLVALGLGISISSKINTEEDLKADLKKQGILPDGIFGWREWEDIKENVDLFIGFIKNTFPDTSYEYHKQQLALSIENEFDNYEGNKALILWNIIGTVNIMSENENTVHFIDMVFGKTIKPHYYLQSYLLALTYIGLYNNEKDVYIDIFDLGGEHKSVIIDYKQNEAIDILKKIYNKAFISKYKKVLPIDLFPEKFESYMDYLKKFEPGNYNYNDPWKYFSARKLFEISKVSGFEENLFIDEWNNEKEKQLEFFIPELIKLICKK